MKSASLPIFAIVCTVAAWTQAAQPQLTARDAFWSAGDLVQVSANPASQPKTSAQPKPATRAAAQRTPARLGSHIDPALVTENGFGARPHFARIAANAPQPLGVRYTVLREKADGGYSELLPDSVFHSGDKIKLSIMANQPGYLYLIERGSSGAWQALFPEPNAAADSNRIEAGRVYEIPSASGHAFEFNDLPGQERLFLLLSRTPVSDLDSVIFDLQRHATPQSEPTEPAGSTQQVADNRISDQLIERLQSRDLTLVTENTASPQGAPDYGEKAVYVVNKGGPGVNPSRVFADFSLRHE